MLCFGYTAAEAILLCDPIKIATTEAQGPSNTFQEYLQQKISPNASGMPRILVLLNLMAKTPVSKTMFPWTIHTN